MWNAQPLYEDAKRFKQYKRGCPGSSSWYRGLSRTPHTDVCREIFRGLMKEEAKVRHAEARKKEFDERMKRR